MTKRTRRNHTPAFKAKVALAAITQATEAGWILVPGYAQKIDCKIRVRRL